MNRDNILFVGYALASAALTIAGAHGVLSGNDVTEITGVLAAFAVAFHIPNAKAAAALKQAEASTTPTPVVVATPASAVNDVGIDALMSGRAES